MGCGRSTDAYNSLLGIVIKNDDYDNFKLSNGQLVKDVEKELAIEGYKNEWMIVDKFLGTPASGEWLENEAGVQPPDFPSYEVCKKTIGLKK